MKAKAIIEDLANCDSPKHLRKVLLTMILEFMANDQIDDRSDAYGTYIVLDNHLKQIDRYFKKRDKKELINSI